MRPHTSFYFLILGFSKQHLVFLDFALASNSLEGVWCGNQNFISGIRKMVSWKRGEKTSEKSATNAEF